MIKLIGISGSLRQASYNAGLLRAAAEAVPEGCTLTTDSIRDIPLYNADIEETEGIPARVNELKEQIAAADGLLLVTPEYNNSMPGVFKNAMDWISRPPQDRPRVFGNRPVGIMGASPGNYGTAFSQNAWLQVMRLLGAQVWSGRMLWVGTAFKKFDKEGNLTDAGTVKQVTKYMEGFVDFVKQVKG